MKKNIFEVMIETLKTNSKYISKDGKLLKATIYRDIMSMDKNLLSLLIKDENISKVFFQEINVGGGLIH